MPYDYTDAPPPTRFELIPHGTVCAVRLHIRAGGVGEGGLLKRTSKGSAALDAEFGVIEGPYAKRKFWGYYILDDATTPSQQDAIADNRGLLKLILDSALGLRPDDVSPEARAARTVDLARFEGIAFIAKIGIEKGKAKEGTPGEFWPDKNILAGVITPDRSGWHPVEQQPPNTNGGGTAAAPTATAPAAAALPVTKPDWA